MMFRVTPLIETDEDAERVMRERRPTALNKDDMLDLMSKTRDTRRAWISTDKPDGTTILRRYPRLGDLMEAVSNLFNFNNIKRKLYLLITDMLWMLYVRT